MFELLTLLLSLCRPARILRWALFLGGMIVLWLVVENATLQDYFKARERRAAYQEQVARLQHQQQQFQREEALLKAGGFPAEKAIRERLGMIKPGEKILFVEPPNAKDPAPADSTPAPAETATAVIRLKTPAEKETPSRKPAAKSGRTSRAKRRTSTSNTN